MDKKLTQANMKKVFESKQVKSLVNAFLMQKTLTEILKDQVAEVYSEILQKFEVFSDAFADSKRGGKVERIFDYKNLYLTKDEETVSKIYDEADRILKAKGIKPLSMEHDYCPALVAEEELRKIEHLLIEATGGPFGVTIESLFTGGNGLNNYNKWIDLAVKAVVNHPDFVNPLTGKKL